LTKPKKSDKRRRYWGRTAPTRHFCPYNTRLLCPFIRGGCPLQDYDFVEDIRFYSLWNRGLKASPLQPRVISESGQVLDSYQLFKALEVTFIFQSVDVLDKVIKLLDAPKERMMVSRRLCRLMRGAYRKWIMHLAPPGHRMQRYQR